MTQAEIKLLPKPAKVAATQALTDMEFGIRKISEMLGIDDKTVLRYRKKELEPEWEQFSLDIKKIYMEQDFELAQLAVKHIKNKIDKARFFELVGLLKTVRELQKPAATTTVQVNQITPIMQSRKAE